MYYYITQGATGGGSSVSGGVASSTDAAAVTGGDSKEEKLLRYSHLYTDYILVGTICIMLWYKLRVLCSYSMTCQVSREDQTAKRGESGE